MVPALEEQALGSGLVIRLSMAQQDKLKSCLRVMCNLNSLHMLKQHL